MSVLSRLALRALGAPSQVRPRLSGLFENGAASGVIEVIAAPAFAAPAEPLTESAGPKLNSPRSVIEAPSARPTAPRRGSPLEAPVARTSGVASPPAERAVRGPLEPHPDFAARDEEPFSSREKPSPVPAATAPTRLILDHSVAPRPLEADADAAEAPAPPRPAPQPYRPLLPPLASRRADPTHAAKPGEKATRSPADLHISIGRIEVRGEPERRPPAPAPRPEPRLMSLEDYLAKGRRR